MSAKDIQTVNAMYGSRTEHPCEYLGVEETLFSGQQVKSCNGRVRFVHQADGNVVLYRNDGKVLWYSDTNGNHTHRLVMQSDGNLVLYSGYGPVWYTETYGRGSGYLNIQDDCNVVLYVNGMPAWQTGTAGCGG